jgi:hypothetical protein
MMKQKNRHAAALGKLGGAACTPAQNAARRKNGKKGGRPKKAVDKRNAQV